MGVSGTLARPRAGRLRYNVQNGDRQSRLLWLYSRMSAGVRI